MTFVASSFSDDDMPEVKRVEAKTSKLKERVKSLVRVGKSLTGRSRRTLHSK